MAGRGSIEGGPLKLEHDVTPIDPARIQVEMDLSSRKNADDSHRFQGFPDHGFSESRRPILGLVEWDGPDKSFKRAQHFVKGVPPGKKRPVVAAARDDQFYDQQNDSRPVEMHRDGIQYGSDGLPPPRTIATPKKTLFFMEDRTSAEKVKRQRQTRDAEWDLARAKQDKQHLDHKSKEEKRKDLEMLKNYKPWGKAGGGAPPKDLQHNKRTKSMQPEKLGEGEYTSYYPGFGKPGNGAPLRTSSGNLITNVRANHDIRFLTTKGMKEHASMSMRYAKPRVEGEKYINELGHMAKEKQHQKEQEKAVDLEQELYAMRHDPFGKQGAGAPLKTDSGNLKTGRNRTLVKHHVEMREVEQKDLVRSRRTSLAETQTGEVYNPWGKGQGVPERDPAGNVRRYNWTDGNHVPEFVDPTIEGATLQTKPTGGGGHKADERGEKVTRYKTTLVHDANAGEHAVYDSPRDGPRDPADPWGRPGAGAPIMNPDGKQVTVKTGKAYYDKLGINSLKPEEQHARKQYLTTLKKEIDDQKNLRHHAENEYKTPGVEVASWIREKEIGYPKRDPNSGAVLPVHHKHTSDVTQQRMDIRRPTEFLDPAEYHTDLSRQAHERHEKLQLDKSHSRDLAQQHYQKFDTLWNKPGNGAPNQSNVRRHDLDMEKHAQTDRFDQPPWKQPHAGSAVPQKAQWNRTKALDHRFQEPGQTKQEYRPRAPWAVTN
ncbi:uncharacterized protein [Amphiura filiformis]|uniref:uncharacterized protein isoform X2 n=1 Tax=Amphiura filiformis TaxID=82378 RepID=UPI003B218DF0